jgi:hypothetical protein
VFAGEVVIMAVVLLFRNVVSDSGGRSRIRIDILSVLLSAAGLVLIVYGLLQTKTWGWILPTQQDISFLGLSLVPFIVGIGAVLLWLFFLRQRRLIRLGRPPLLNTAILRLQQLRAGVGSLGIQYTVTAGLFFVVPIFLQLSLGLDALSTGLRIFPLSVALVLFSILGTVLARRLSPKLIARIGQFGLVLSSLVLLGSVDTTLDNWIFGTGMFLAGAALGLLASQLGNVTMSAVQDDELSEAGGVQGVFQNLGSSLGTALIGSVMIASLTTLFSGGVAASSLPDSVQQEVATRTAAGVAVVPVADVPKIATDAGLSQEEADQLSSIYSTAQLDALRLSFAALAMVSLGAVFFSRNLPSSVLGRPENDDDEDGADAPPAAAASA